MNRGQFGEPGQLKDRQVRVAIIIGVIAIAVRLIGINQPFVDRWSWRQSDVAAIARNYFQNGFHFAYPQIDWAGEYPGYVGTEFPVLPFIAALCYKFLGIHEWVGRSQAVIFFAISLPFFFLLVREIFGPIAATWALFFYSFAPLGVMASRCFIPDMPSMSLSIAGLYLFYRWSQAGGRRWLLASAVSISLSILLKAPSAIIGVPLAYLCFQRFGPAALRRIDLWIFAAVALIPASFWYWHAHRVAVEYFPFHFFGAGGIRIMNIEWYSKIAQRTVMFGITPLMFTIALPGLFASPQTAGRRLFHWWLGAMLIFIVAVGYGNRHPWYQLSLVPIFAVFAGAGCAGFRELMPFAVWLRGAAVFIAAWFCLLSFLSLRWWYFGSAADLAAAGLELKRTTNPAALIVAVNYGDPTIFYYAQRKGWNFLEKDAIYYGHPASSGDAVTGLEKLKRHGATHLVFYSSSFWWLEHYLEFAEQLDATTTLVSATPQFKIYKLDAAGR